MFAVLHVSNFSLQALIRTDPTLRPVAVPATRESGGAFAPRKENQLGLSLLSEDVFADENAPLPNVRDESPQLAVAEGSASESSEDAASVSRVNLRELAVGLVSSDTKKALILQVNAVARLAGVEIGMTAPQAQARCADIILRQISPAADAEAQRALLACALNVSPMVEDTAPGVCTIDVRGLAPENRSRVLANAVCQLSELGLQTTGGIAPTPLLALYAARETTAIRTVDKPEGFLHPLPLAIAEPPPALAAILHSWGITRIGQFAALSKQEVVRRLGAEGHAFWDRARGGDSRPLKPYALPAQFAASLDLEYELETTEGVLFIVRRFVDRLALELRTAGRVAAELTLDLKLADETHHTRSFRLPEPTAREDILFRTIDTYLESVRTEAGVVGVALSIEPVRPLVRQPGLFETGLRDPHGFAETLARVTAVVGSGQLGTPELEDTHRPDAVKLITPPHIVPAAEQTPVWPMTGLPLRRYRPAVLAHVELAGSGKPAFVTGPQIHSPVLAVRGPFRSSGEWWKTESWSREEWDVELALGGIYRVARIKEEWYLDGEYE
ncbi:MAG TPA: DNA polymerase Y family protein [Opitutaceae bacterium]|nr:DNA polymerase Y family protein [Opitutaceae bacterium]